MPLFCKRISYAIKQLLDRYGDEIFGKRKKQAFAELEASTENAEEKEIIRQLLNHWDVLESIYRLPRPLPKLDTNMFVKYTHGKVRCYNGYIKMFFLAVGYSFKEVNDALYPAGAMLSKSGMEKWKKEDFQGAITDLYKAIHFGCFDAIYDIFDDLTERETYNEGADFSDLKIRLALIGVDSEIPRAYTLLGILYEELEDDIPEAYNQYLQAHKLGDALGTAHLGSLLISGEGVNQNIDLGVSLLEDAAKRGCAFACVELGDYYSLTLEKPKMGRAARYYTQALSLNPRNEDKGQAYLGLGWCYSFGDTELTPETILFNEDKAVGYYLKAAEITVLGYYNLALAYEKGQFIIGVDREKARYYYQLALEQFTPDAAIEAFGDTDSPILKELLAKL